MPRLSRLPQVLARTIRALSPGSVREVRAAQHAQQGGPVPRVVTLKSRASLVGRPHIVDGNTLIVRQTRVHLAGLAPLAGESPETRRARNALRDLCAGQIVRVDILEGGPRAGASVIGRARLPDGRDLSDEMLARGAKPVSTAAAA